LAAPGIAAAVGAAGSCNVIGGFRNLSVGGCRRDCVGCPAGRFKPSVFEQASWRPQRVEFSARRAATDGGHAVRQEPRTMANQPIRIERPLVIMFEAGGEIVCHIHPSDKASSHEHYGLLICDLVRHVAQAFKVDEADVWEWVDKERNNPTTRIDVAT
jgi:hypothetical protein